jgi:hypothetical protein
MAVVREPEAVIRRFIAWYRSIGAARILLFLDDPGDPCLPRLERMGDVDVVRCTPEFWAGLGASPETPFNERQNLALTHGYRSVATEWVLSVDADELLSLETGSIDTFLASQRPGLRTVLIEPVERVVIQGHPDRLVFRRGMQPKYLPAYEDERIRTTMRMRRGMMGHRGGKSFIRAGDGRLQLNPHFPRIGDAAVIEHRVRVEDGAMLLHFLASDFDDWCRKLPDRLKNSSLAGLKPVIAEAFDAEDRTALRRLFDLLFTCEPRRSRRLIRLSQMFEVRPHFGQLLRRHLKDWPVDDPAEAALQRVGSRRAGPRVRPASAHPATGPGAASRFAAE